MNDPDTYTESAKILRDRERAEAAQADTGERRPLGYTGPVWAEWEIPTRAEAERDECWP